MLGVHMIIEQVGTDCRVTMYGVTRIISNCSALKLAATMFDKPVPDKYTVDEMYDFGFDLR